VLVHIPLTDQEFGNSAEREAIFALENQLLAAIQAAGAGEFDGNEFGDGQCTLYMYGNDADRLFGSIEAILRSSPLASRGNAIVRYGPPGAGHKQVSLSGET
jgi:hypothetical protein